MRYAVAKYNDRIREKAYRFYVTDSIYAYTQNKCLGYRYRDLFDQKPAEKEKTGDEIIAEVMQGAGLKFEE